MLSSKLLPEMEVEDNTKREQFLIGMQNLPIPKQIEKIKARIDMIGAACESAEKLIAELRKVYNLGARQAASVLPTIDKVQAAKIQEQENLLRAAVNSGSRMQVDQRQLPASLPVHLVDVLTVGDAPQNFPDASGMYSKNTPTSNNANSQGTLLQATAAQLIGRSIPSPGMTGAASFDNTTTSPLPYANSPRSGTNIMNTPSPQQQTQQQQQQQQQFQQQQQQQQQLQLQRQKMMQQLPPHQQQLFAQQSLRQNSGQGVGQTQLSQLHDLSGTSQKFQTMQYSQPLGNQQFQGRQLQSGQMQHAIGQNQLNQGNLRNHLSQLAGTANSALFSAAQSSPNSQMIPNMSSNIASQALLPRTQYGVSAAHQQRNPSSILSDQ
ncbi:hypothetical protein MKW94_018913, partial [Papaver nudicaule]|nr:hypothetical protein [Papaver nudicaule]